MGMFVKQVQVAKVSFKRLKTLRHPSILTYVDGLEVRVWDIFLLLLKEVIIFYVYIVIDKSFAMFIYIYKLNLIGLHLIFIIILLLYVVANYVYYLWHSCANLEAVVKHL